MYVVETHGLTKEYGGKRVVDNFSMHIRQGDIYGFIGKNGAGKSTVLKMINAMVRPNSGEIVLFGQKEGSGGYLPSERPICRIGSLIEQPGLILGLSAFDNIMVKALAMGLADPKERSNEALRMVGMDAVGRKAVKRFSQGMKQRVGIAIALLGIPDLLILDEPFNGLDPETTRDIRNLIVRLNESFGVSVIVSSHVLDQLDRMVSCYGVISSGHMVRELSADEVVKECGDSIRIRTTETAVSLANLEQVFSDCVFTVEPDGAIRVSGTVCIAQIAEILHECGDTVLELSEIKRDVEEYFIEMMEGRCDDAQYV